MNAMRSIGLGHSALERFCGMMNMPQPVAKNCSMKLSNKLKGSAQLIAEQSMAAAVREVTGIKGTNDIGCLLIERDKREVLYLLTVFWLPFI